MPQVQLTISIYIVGFATGQLVYGPLSDRYGRRPVMLAALGALLRRGPRCVRRRHRSQTLLVARFVQGLGASGAIVLARAIIRDLYEGPRAARERCPPWR